MGGWVVGFLVVVGTSRKKIGKIIFNIFEGKMNQQNQLKPVIGNIYANTYASTK